MRFETTHADTARSATVTPISGHVAGHTSVTSNWMGIGCVKNCPT